MKVFSFLLFFFQLALAQTFQSVIERLEQTPVERRQSVIEKYLNTKRTSPIIEQDTLLHFVLYGAADSVFVNGNLQHWNDPVRLETISCGLYSLFYITFSVPADARLDYQLIINGTAKTDPQNPNITPSGFGPHSEVRMPKFVPTPYLSFRRDIPHGTIDSLAPSVNLLPPLNRYRIPPRPVKVYRPPGYDTLAHLPVLYVHDGFEAIDFALLPTVIDNLIAEQKISPILAVFIPPSERMDEYLLRRQDQFVQFLSHEIVPMIDAVYKTEPDPSSRAMIGISNGGHISLYTVLSRPDVFQMAAGQSSTISPWLTELTIRQKQLNRLSPQLKLYLDCGRYDIKGVSPIFGAFEFLELNRSYSDLLSSLRIPHYYKEVNDGHEWASWRERMPDILIYFFGKYQ